MHFSRSLRKAITAYLAFTVLAIPIAGCDFLDDFFDDGKPPASTSGKKNEPELPKGAVSVKLPKANAERRAVEAIGMDALRYYVHARLATEKLSRMTAKNSKPKDFEKLLRETAKLWEYADLYANASKKFGAELAKKETKPGYKPLAMIDTSPFGRSMLFSVAFAREGTDKDEAGMRPMTKYERDMMEHHPAWSEGIVKTYEQFPAGKGIEGLAQKLGVDAKEANRQFQKAVGNLDKGNKTAATVYDVGTKTALVVKGGCQTALLVGGMVLTGGATGPAAAVGAVNSLAATADWVVEITNISHEVITGESNPQLDEIKKYTGTISALTSGATIVTSFSDFALKGDKAVQLTHDALKGAGLKNITGYLDKFKIGGAGVSAILDSSIWTADRVMESKEGKVLGFQVFTDKKGNTVMVPVEVPKDLYKSPQELSKIANSELKLLAMTPDNLKNLFQQINALTDTDNLAKEIAEEDARRRQEIADAEDRRREEAKRNRGPGNVSPAGQIDMYARVQRNKDGSTQSRSSANQALPYEPSKLAGYYTITSPSGDMAMRAYIKATGDNTIRVIQVQKKTDTKGTPLFSATIDPKKGGGKTDQGAVIKFQRDGSGAYTAGMDDGHKAWRFTKH